MQEYVYSACISSDQMGDLGVLLSEMSIETIACEAYFLYNYNFCMRKV